MQSGYYAAAGGMVSQFNRLDTIANNLANVNTSGFKKDALITGDFLRMYQQARDELPLENQTKEGAKFYNRSMTRVPQIVEEYTDHSVGNLQKTDNTLDFALSREGLFFAVKTPQGVRLSREGSFTLDDTGKLVTKQGYEVLSEDYDDMGGGITFSVRDTVIEADKNGQLYVALPGSSKMVQSSKMLIVEPQNVRLLQKEGDNLYIPAGPDDLRAQDESGAVIQGFVEKSNVNAVDEMIALIEAQRLVGMYQKAMDSQMNDLNRDAIEKLAYVRK